MAVSVTRQQVRSVVTGTGEPLFRVTDTCTASVGIPRALYVVTLEGAYSHTARAADLVLYPEDVAAARQARLGFYRVNTVTLDFPDAEAAKAFAEDIAYRVQWLCNEYDGIYRSFIGDGQPITSTITSQP